MAPGAHLNVAPTTTAAGSRLVCRYVNAMSARPDGLHPALCVHDARAHQRFAHFAAECTRVHVHRTAHRPRDADAEFEPRAPGLGHLARERRERRTALRPHRALVDAHSRHVLGQLDHDAVVAAVAHDQVRALAHRQVGNACGRSRDRTTRATSAGTRGSTITARRTPDADGRVLRHRLVRAHAFRQERAQARVPCRSSRFGLSPCILSFSTRAPRRSSSFSPALSMSPAPIVITMSPSRTCSATRRARVFVGARARPRSCCPL